MERVGSITGTLFFMEVIVLDEGFYPILLHELVIFFRTVTESATQIFGKRL